MSGLEALFAAGDLHIKAGLGCKQHSKVKTSEGVWVHPMVTPGSACDLVSEAERFHLLRNCSSMLKGWKHLFAASCNEAGWIAILMVWICEPHLSRQDLEG